MRNNHCKFSFRFHSYVLSIDGCQCIRSTGKITNLNMSKLLHVAKLLQKKKGQHGMASVPSVQFKGVHTLS